LLRQRPALLADLLLPDHDLDAARQVGDLFHGAFPFALQLAQCGFSRAVLDVEEMNLAALAPADDPPGDAHPRPLVVEKIARQLEDVGDGCMAIKTAAPGIEPEALDRLELFGATGLETVLR
jgi:hypothetical protein